MNDIGLILDKEKTLEQIFKVCNYYNIKNKDLADFMDTSEVEVCNWKTNKRFPGWDKIIIFAYVFQIPLDKLVVRKITQENDTVHDIREKIKSIDESKLNDLVSNVEKAKSLAEKALKELNDGNYTSEYKYVEMFGKSDYVYTLNKGDELKGEMDQIYMEFSNWLGNWEM